MPRKHLVGAMRMRPNAWACFLVATLLLAPALAASQTTWPNRPIRFIVPFAPGGGVDATAMRAELAALTTRNSGNPPAS